MNLASQERLKAVFPKLAQKVYQLSTLCAAEDVFITVAAGLRTVDEQHALWLKGRSGPRSKRAFRRTRYEFR